MNFMCVPTNKNTPSPQLKSLPRFGLQNIKTLYFFSGRIITLVLHSYGNPNDNKDSRFKLINLTSLM